MFSILGAKNLVKFDDFGALEAENQDIYSVFGSGSKSHGIYSVFLLRVEQKHWYSRSFQHVARRRFYLWTTQKPVFYDVFASWAGILVFHGFNKFQLLRQWKFAVSWIELLPRIVVACEGFMQQVFWTSGKGEGFVVEPFSMRLFRHIRSQNVFGDQPLASHMGMLPCWWVWEDMYTSPMNYLPKL